MMRYCIALLLMISNGLYAKYPESPPRGVVERKGAAAAQSSYDSVAYSMMLYGVGLCAVAAAGAAFIQGSKGATNTSGSGTAHFYPFGGNP